MTNETDSHRSHQEDIIWLTAIVSESIIIFIVNAFALITFARNLHLRNRSTYLIINLTVADLMVGAVTAPMEIYSPDTEYEVGFKWQQFIILLFYSIFPISSMANLSLISLERLHATLYPFRHCFIGERVYGIIICCSWLLGLIIASVDAVLYQNVPLGSYYLWTSFIVLTLLILTVSYVIVIVKITSNPSRHPFGAVGASERKLSFTLFIVTSISVLTILPYAVYAIIPFHMWTELSKTAHFHVRLSVYVLYYACSLVNPLIYAIRMKGFRRALLKPFIVRKTVKSSRVHVQHIELRALEISRDIPGTGMLQV